MTVWAPKQAICNDRAEAARDPHPRRNALLCALVAGSCALAVYPVSGMARIDDWSYVKTALDFANTGHILYNGWGAPMLGWQVLWGALFIKIFGFSFTTLRISTWLIAIASVSLFHQILIRFGIASRLAVFGALTFGLSPLFVPMASSFMTEVPSLFVILVCIYMCQRAVAAETDRATLLWLCSAALMNVAGGTVRQIAWLGALVMVPSTAWLLRRRWGVLSSAIGMWVASLVAILYLLDWFHRQPYVVSERAFVSVPLPSHAAYHFAVLSVRMVLCLLLLALPVAIRWLPETRRLSPRALGRIAIIMLALIAAYIVLAKHGKLENNIMPWLEDILESLGIHASRSIYMLCPEPLTMGVGTRVATSLIVVATGLAFVEEAFAGRRPVAPAPVTPIPVAPISEEFKASYWQTIFWILVPFTAGYLCLLFPRGIHGITYDRYLLPLLPLVIVVLLRLHQESWGGKPAAISWAVLIVFSLYTTAAVHDQFALYRARVLAADKLLENGVPRTEIEGGFEFDGWTQVQNGGHINEKFIRFPKGAYNPNLHSQPVASDCARFGLSASMPAIKPEYYVTLRPMNCLTPSNYPPVAYTTWLPPFDREIYIQQAQVHSN